MSSQYGPQYFPNLSNAFINRPTITHVSVSNNPERRGFTLLLDNISRGAFHDAEERGDPPKCHPHTRVAIQAEIMEWVKAPEARRKLIIWMYGPAGSGKTAIGQSIAEECKERGLLAASFFFSRTAIGRDDTTRLAATIAYQISRLFPQIEDHLFTAVERDPTIFSRTLATQIKELVIQPLKASPPPLKPIFVILDGVDEIGPDFQSRADLLNIIGTAVSELQHIPLIFLIASRPEYEIREAFNRPLLSSTAQSLALDDCYKPDEDIRLYFDSRFKDIYDRHLQLGTRFCSPWPSKDDVDWLVSKASGQFIFAATVIKFIDSIRHHPAERLGIILGVLTAGNETPFALLDALYHHILSSVTDLEKVLKILTVLVLPVHRDFELRVKDVEQLLDFEVRRVLVDMHALVFVPPSSDDISELRIHHASLYDFLLDQSRSNNFYIDPSLGHLALTRCWSKVIAKYQISDQKMYLGHCIDGFAFHFRKSAAPSNGEFINDFAHFELRKHLEEVACELSDLYLTNWDEFFDCIQQHVGDRTEVFRKLQDAFDGFVLERLSKYPPELQEHIPAILTLAGTSKTLNGDIFTILLHASTSSETELNKGLQLDSTLLNIAELPLTGINGCFASLFQDYRAGGYYVVYGLDYLKLAKEVIGVIFPKPGEYNQQLKFQASPYNGRIVYGLDGSPSLPLQDEFLWFETMLWRTPTDTDLAQILLERGLQYREDAELKYGWENIARCSLEYIQGCDIPYLEHAHLPGTNKCVVCDHSDGASIVDLAQLGTHISPASESEFSSPVSEVYDSF